MSLPVPTAKALMEWVKVRGDWEGPLFINFDATAKGRSRRLASACYVKDFDWQDRWTPYVVELCGEVIDELRFPPPLGDHQWGFYGVLPRNIQNPPLPVDLTAEEMQRFWLLACKSVESVFEEDDERVIRNFLRSRWGRHLADEATNLWLQGEDLDAAISSAIGRRTRDGRLAWQEPFDAVRAATLDGTWQEHPYPDGSNR